MTGSAQLIDELERLWVSSVDSGPERARKLARRAELAGALCTAVDSAVTDVATCYSAARVLRYVQSTGTEFVEAAQRLAKASWERGHTDSGALYASTTDILCNLKGRPQRYGTKTFLRYGEKVLAPVDPEVTDAERRELGLPTLSEIESEIERHNRQLAEHLAATTGLPEGATLRRVWRHEDPNALRARYQAEGPVWRDGDELVFVWQAEAVKVSVVGSIREGMALWPLPDSDVWLLRLRIRDLDRAVLSHGFVGHQQPGGPTVVLGGDGCWRGPAAPAEPCRHKPVAGSLRELTLPGPHVGEQRSITAYLPPSHSPRRSYPVVYLTDGHLTSPLAEVVDAAILGGSIPPVVLVGVASGHLPGENLRNNEYILGRHAERFEAHRKFFVDDVARWAESELGASTAPDRRIVFGVSAGAAFAVAMGLRHPDRYGNVLAFSLGGIVPGDDFDWPSNEVPGHYFVAGTLEEGFPELTAKWVAHVGDAGGACVHVEMVSGHDYRMWDAAFPTAVAWALN